MSQVRIILTYLLTASASFVVPLSATAQDGMVDHRDFLVWNSSLSFAQDEVVEFSVEYVDPPVASESGEECRLELSENNGSVLGSVEITFTGLGLSSTRVGNSRGFGFIEKAMKVESGMLQVNGVAVAPLAVSPWSNRYSLGLSILCNQPATSATRQLSGVRWMLLGPDNSTRAADGVDLNRNYAQHWGYDN